MKPQKYRLSKSHEDGLWRVRSQSGIKPLVVAKTPGKAMDKLRRRIEQHRRAH